MFILIFLSSQCKVNQIWLKSVYILKNHTTSLVTCASTHFSLDMFVGVWSTKTMYGPLFSLNPFAQFSNTLWCYLDFCWLVYRKVNHKITKSKYFIFSMPLRITSQWLQVKRRRNTSCNAKCVRNKYHKKCSISHF